jgi:hypothetical protein
VQAAIGAASHTRRPRRRTPCNDRLELALVLALAAATMLFSSRAPAQQFNSDNYWTAPEGTMTVVATVGQQYSTLVDVVTLFPGWEFNIGATLYKEDVLTDTTSHYSTTAYVKHMFYENEAKTGGWAVMAGTGVNPGYLERGTVTRSFKTYWIAAPVTFPFWDNTVSWDIMPGGLLNLEQGPNEERTTGFTWSTRLGVYKLIPQSAIVGEVFGVEGDARVQSQYKAGVRWESKYVIAALTYGGGLDGSRGAGLEFGVMFLSPPFLCIGGCQ